MNKTLSQRSTPMLAKPLSHTAAREKAEPVAWAVFTDGRLIRMWSRDWMPDANAAGLKNQVPLYTTPPSTPSDQAKINALVEALKLCYDHCCLYHPATKRNNVGESVRAALALAGTP